MPTIRTYAGYTTEELSGGKPCVIVEKGEQAK
jgi:hypothetical protein